jgi:hypothetical protein
MRPLSRKKIVKLLKAAEKAFRLPPSLLEMNYLGLCDYLDKHPLIIGLTEKRRKEYLKEILGEKYKRHTFTFCESHSQKWVYKVYGGLKKFKRADFCLERLKDYETV